VTKVRQRHDPTNPPSSPIFDGAGGCLRGFDLDVAISAHSTPPPPTHTGNEKGGGGRGKGWKGEREAEEVYRWRRGSGCHGLRRPGDWQSPCDCWISGRYYWVERIAALEAETSQQMPKFPQELREQGKIGLANRGEDILCHWIKRQTGEEVMHSRDLIAWWLQWLEWESLWTQVSTAHDVTTWNTGPQGIDLSMYQIAQTLSKGAAVVMFQEVSFHPGERRRIKSTLKAPSQEYWCVMEASQRVRVGRELLKVGMSK
jgi:hypothetical protein